MLTPSFVLLLSHFVLFAICVVCVVQYLTFLGNRAFATSGGKFPDENYARELMQLFTIGLWELEVDGTQKKDKVTGLPISTYTNDDIMARKRTVKSRAWSLSLGLLLLWSFSLTR